MGSRKYLLDNPHTSPVRPIEEVSQSLLYIVQLVDRDLFKLLPEIFLVLGYNLEKPATISTLFSDLHKNFFSLPKYRAHD
jgi:hypothetical protein